MVEVIERHEGFQSNVHKLPGNGVQISYNSDGRLVIRSIDTQQSDALIILDRIAALKVIGFCKEINEGLKVDGVPF